MSRGRQTVTQAERDRLMGIEGLVNCAGCPSGEPMVPANSPHEGLCEKHYREYERVSSMFNTGA